MSEHIQNRVDDERAARPSREVYEYDVPDKIANGVKTVGMVKLTAREEMVTAARARNDAIRLAYELAKASLVEINGEIIDKSNGDDDVAWEKMDPQVRELVMVSYSDLHNVPSEDTESFLASRRVRA